MVDRSHLIRVCGLTVSGLLAMLPVPAHAARTDFFSEARTSSFWMTASAGQLGTGDSSGLCGLDPTMDAGQEVSGTAALLVSDARFRHQLAVSLGYIAPVCTTILRRPMGGFDYRGEYAFSARTRFSGQARANVDVFDRTLDIRSGSASSGGTGSGQFFLTGQANFEFAHTFSRQFGARAAASWKALEPFGSLDALPNFLTLGPMESIEGVAAFGRVFDRHRLELSFRYRASWFYAGTVKDLFPREQVKPAHDGFLSGTWEYKLDRRFAFRTETGLAAAMQPHLCEVFDPLIRASGGCSIDGAAGGIRGLEDAPPLEWAFSKTGTLTVAGELALDYTGPRRRMNLRLARGYEPDPYGAGLTLWDRLAADFSVMPKWGVALYGSAQLLHGVQTSPARVSPLPEGVALQPVSPQNRTLYLAMGNVGASYDVAGPVAVFVEANVFAMAIRGAGVSETPAEGKTYPAEVARFPQDPAQATQNTARCTVFVGVRARFETMANSRREADLLQNVRLFP